MAEHEVQIMFKLPQTEIKARKFHLKVITQTWTRNRLRREAEKKKLLAILFQDQLSTCKNPFWLIVDDVVLILECQRCDHCTYSFQILLISFYAIFKCNNRIHVLEDIITAGPVKEETVLSVHNHQAPRQEKQDLKSNWVPFRYDRGVPIYQRPAT